MANISSSEAAAVLASMRKTFRGGRPAVLKWCPHCKLKFKSREFTRHEPTCRALHNPNEEPKVGRPLGYRKPVLQVKAKTKAKG